MAAGAQQERAAGRVRHRGHGGGASGCSRAGTGEEPGERLQASPTATAACMATMPGFASGSPSAARKPSTPNAANPNAAAAKRRTARIPSPAPNARAASTTTTSRASLSLVPNRATTKSLAPGGWRSMTCWPTAATSEVAPGSNAATSSEMPRARPAAATPAAAARTRFAARRAGMPGCSVDAEVLTASWCTSPVTFACRRPGRFRTAREISRGGASAPSSVRRAARRPAAARTPP